MEKSFVLLVVATVAIFPLCYAVRIRCPRNEILTRCVNPCLPTCSDPNRKPCPIEYCVEGCVCRRGLIRNDITGECVPRDLCPIECKDPNEVFTDCGVRCNDTCQTPCKKEPCIERCRPMCVCIEGFTWDEVSQQCVPTEKCPKCDCGEDKIYTPCGGICIITCQNLKDPPVCPVDHHCKPACICKEGLILDEVSGKCVRREECSRLE